MGPNGARSPTALETPEAETALLNDVSELLRTLTGQTVNLVVKRRVVLPPNAPAAVTRSAVYYLVRCLCPHDTPTNDGLLHDVDLRLPAGCLLDAQPPHPVAGGNVETSQRVVDALWLAAAKLWRDRMPAPGAGTFSISKWVRLL